MTVEEKYFKKLTKLIKNVPEGFKLVYDTHQVKLFLVKEDGEFIEGKLSNGGTSWHGVLTSVSEPTGKEGYTRDSVIGCVDITMEAVQDHRDY